MLLFIRNLDYPSYIDFQSFFKWLDESITYFPKLDLKFFSNYNRGIFTKEKIHKDEIFMKIPATMLITLEIAKESPIGMKMVNENLSLLSPKHCYMATFLLQQKTNPNSKWDNYLKILPQGYENFPIFYSEEEKKWLDGSPFYYQINEKINEIKTDYKTILAKIPEFENFSLREFSEARMVASSRIFGIKINNKKTDCFAPLADMLNHRRPRKTKWYYSDQIKSFVIHAMNEIEKGEEVSLKNIELCYFRFLIVMAENAIRDFY